MQGPQNCVLVAFAAPGQKTVVFVDNVPDSVSVSVSGK